MKLNTLKNPAGRRPHKRVGRGHAAGQGKPCGRGQKGQHARSGGYHKVGFEGGQMPLQRRLPKVGFISRRRGETAELRLHQLALPGEDIVDLDALKRAGIVGQRVTRAKVIRSGKLDKAVTIRGLSVSAGAKRAIEAAGGSVEE